MTKKDYIEIANILKHHQIGNGQNWDITLGNGLNITSGYNQMLLNSFVALFEKDNPNFNKEVFIKAVKN